MMLGVTRILSIRKELGRIESPTEITRRVEPSSIMMDKLKDRKEK